MLTRLCSKSFKLASAVRELLDVQDGFRKGRGTRDQIDNIGWITEKAKDSRKTSTSSSLTMLKHLTVDHNKLWKILQEMGIPYHVPWLLRNLYAGQEGTVRTRHGLIQNWEKSTSDLYIVTCLFNLYAEYIM